jgi:hypothetical protein
MVADAVTAITSDGGTVDSQRASGNTVTAIPADRAVVDYQRECAPVRDAARAIPVDGALVDRHCAVALEDSPIHVYAAMWHMAMPNGGIPADRAFVDHQCASNRRNSAATGAAKSANKEAPVNRDGIPANGAVVDCQCAKFKMPPPIMPQPELMAL